MDSLVEKVVRGGAAKLVGQVAILLLRLGFTALTARLLLPEDFGLVAMVIAVTGVYELFTTAGLSMAAVQAPSINDEQVSNLFWVNLLVGLILAAMCVATAPVLVAFYHEPRLFWICVAMGGGFLFNAAGVQHSAMLQRQLRYVDITIIELGGLLSSYALGIALALFDFGYWALVTSAVAYPGTSSILKWAFTGWVPRRPNRKGHIRAMLGFGGIVTLNNLIVYAAYNCDKLLIGRIWGPGALGIYGTSYQLANVPTSNFTAAIGGIAFSALARLQDDPLRLKGYFLRGITLLLSITAPVTLFSALFADDIVLLFLGPNWTQAATIFRLLTPTVVVFSIINPTGWLLQSIGLQKRSLAIALAIAPLVISAYIFGLPYGPEGVAFGFSAAMVLWLLPSVIWCLHDTMISPREFLLTVSRPLLASVGAAFLTFLVSQAWLDPQLPHLLRVSVAGVTMLGFYACILWFVIGQRILHQDLLRALKGSSAIRPASQ